METDLQQGHHHGLTSQDGPTAAFYPQKAESPESDSCRVPRREAMGVVGALTDGGDDRGCKNHRVGPVPVVEGLVPHDGHALSRCIRHYLKRQQSQRTSEVLDSV